MNRYGGVTSAWYQEPPTSSSTAPSTPRCWGWRATNRRARPITAPRARSAGGRSPRADRRGHHRPRERAADGPHVEAAAHQLGERLLAPVVDVARRVAEVLDVLAACQVGRAPDRFARHRHHEVAPADAG